MAATTTRVRTQAVFRVTGRYYPGDTIATCQFAYDGDKLQQRTYSRVIWFSLLVFSMVHVCLPFVRGKLTSGHDTLRYIPRLVEFHENFRQGNAIPRWAPDLILGQGQPLFYFSPPLPYYVSEAWRIFFADTLGTLNWGYISMILVSAISMFFLCSLFFGERGGVLGAVAYIYSPYFHVDLFVRGAYSEVSAMAFYPLALYGFARHAIEKDLRALLLGAAALAAVVLSHNPTALLIMPMLAAIAIYYAVEQRSKKLLAMQAAALAIGVSLAAFFWLPALVEIGNVHAERLTGGYFDYRLHFVELRQLVSTYWGYGGSVEGPGDLMSLSLGWSHVLLALVALAASIWFRSAMQRVQWFFAAALVGFCILMLPVSAGIWQTVPLLQFTQFPWRLLGPASVCLAVLIASLAAVSYENWRVNAIVGVAVSLLLLQNWHHAAPQKYVDLKPEDWTA